MLPSAPKRPKPDAFYLEHMPAFWSALLDGVAPQALELAIQVYIERAGEPLRYVVSARGAQVSARTGSTDEPQVTLSFALDAFRTATRDLWPRAARRLAEVEQRAREHIGELFVGVDTRAWLASMLELPGELTIAYTDDAGDTSMARVTIGSGRGAHARVAATDADVTRLLDGSSSLLHLLKSRVSIEGNSGWVLRLATRLRPGG